MRKRYDRYSAAVLRSKRWKGVRLEVKRRDGWKCVQCKSPNRLEVDHIKPVKTHPDLAFDLTNLQTLCISCHSQKTRLEVGMGELNPKREAWKDAVAELRPKRNKQCKENKTCLNH